VQEYEKEFFNHEKHENHEKEKEQEMINIIFKEECYQIIVEIKAVRKIAPEHKAQVINYLKATNFKLGLLIKFGEFPKASVTRLVC